MPGASDAAWLASAYNARFRAEAGSTDDELPALSRGLAKRMRAPASR